MNNRSDSEGKGERSHGHLEPVIWQLDEMRLFVASSAPTDAPVSVGGKPLLGACTCQHRPRERLNYRRKVAKISEPDVEKRLQK